MFKPFSDCFTDRSKVVLHLRILFVIYASRLSYNNGLYTQDHSECNTYYMLDNLRMFRRITFKLGIRIFQPDRNFFSIHRLLNSKSQQMGISHHKQKVTKSRNGEYHSRRKIKSHDSDILSYVTLEYRTSNLYMYLV